MQILNDAETPLAAVRACFEELGRTIGIAHSLVRAGKQVDLAGLDAEMGFVCARALDLLPEDGRTVRPDLLGLRAEVEALTAALVSRGAPQG